MARLTNKPINTIFAGPSHENCPYKRDLVLGTAALPGTIVTGDSGSFEPMTSANSIAGQKPYILDQQVFTGLKIDVQSPAGDTAAAYEIQANKFYYVLSLTGQALTVGTPLKLSATAGALDIGDPATDTIVARSAETYTTTATELVLVENYYA